MEISFCNKGPKLNDVILRHDGQKLEIYYADNGDLYWRVSGAKSDDRTIEFFVTKEDMEIYNIFLELYNNIINCKFNGDEEEIEFNLNFDDIFAFLQGDIDYKETKAYKLLVQGENIVWHSDSTFFAESNVLNIVPEKDCFRLEFCLGKSNKEMFGDSMISIRICNDGSLYAPFNMMFMEHFNKLFTVDPNYHQIHVEEYLLQLNKSTKNS